MAIITTTTLEFEEEASSENLAEIASNTILMVMTDGTGKKQVLRLKTDAIQENDVLLRNTTTGLCYKFINGQWIWVPC
ncbi:MAG: hypothetical protein EKK68_01065 [Candidatus Competibacteraceae bacterium]|nr:MAG: hypothetical protein EKK68_01065 [Candidatus Competibacteraceae bacterium]